MTRRSPPAPAKDFESRQQKCKHVFAVEYVAQRESVSNGDGTETGLIQSHYELGINTTFCGKEDAAIKSEAVEAEIDPVEAYAWV